jgi:glutamate racemase
MLKKVVVFDSGFGGELFANYIEKELPVVEVIRVIDWRNLDIITKKPKETKNVTEQAIRPYIGHVDLIIFANYLVTFMDLKYFQREYPSQKFMGFAMPQVKSRKALILTSKALHKSHAFKKYVRGLRANTRTIDCDSWIPLIDDAELTEDHVRKDLLKLNGFLPQTVALAYTNFVDIKPMLFKIFGPMINISDGYRDTLHNVCQELGLRGLDGRRNK